MTDANDFDATNLYYPQDKWGSHRGRAAELFGITSFEENLYIRRKYLKTLRLRPNWIPRFCNYKFLYVWLDLRLADGAKEPFVGWPYWLPNPLLPLLPFLAFRPAVSRFSSFLQIEEISC